MDVLVEASCQGAGEVHAIELENKKTEKQQEQYRKVNSRVESVYSIQRQLMREHTFCLRWPLRQHPRRCSIAMPTWSHQEILSRRREYQEFSQSCHHEMNVVYLLRCKKLTRSWLRWPCCCTRKYFFALQTASQASCTNNLDVESSGDSIDEQVDAMSYCPRLSDPAASCGQRRCVATRFAESTPLTYYMPSQPGPSH